MSPQRRRAAAVRLVTMLVLLLVTIYLLWRTFIGVPPAPPPKVTPASLSAHSHA